MYHVSAQGVDEHTINVHYYYDYNVEILLQLKADEIGKGKRDKTATKNQYQSPPTFQTKKGYRVCQYIISCSVLFRVSMRSVKPIGAPPSLSDVYPTLPLKRFQCSSDRPDGPLSFFQGRSSSG